MTEQIEQLRLENGMQVVLEPMPYVKTAAFGIFVGAGSVCETKENNGISHMIEHMLFKGTKTRSAKALADITARLGDTVNAYTGKEYTAYYGLTIAEELPTLMEVLADMLQHSTFERKALSKEKGVVCEEIDMYNDSPDDLVHELAQKRAWQTHSLGYQISGTKGVVRGLTREKLLTYFQNEYRPERMVLSVAGAFDREEVLEQLTELFGETSSYTKVYNMKNMTTEKTGATGGLPSRTAADYTRCFSRAERDTAQLHMNLVFPGISYLDERRHIATVFHSVLGGSNNSLLFQKIREEEGLAYSVYSYGCPYAKEGLLHIDAVSAPSQAEAILEHTLGLCETLREKEISEETLQTHKALIRTEAILSKESVQSRMEGNGRSVLLRGRVIPQEEDLRNVEAVNGAMLQAYAREILRTDKMSMCLVGEMGSAGRRLQKRFENH